MLKYRSAANTIGEVGRISLSPIVINASPSVCRCITEPTLRLVSA
jgi:hypothetical protein